MSRLLSRAHQWRLTWSLSTRLSSGISDSKTLKRMAFDAREKREKERAEKHEMVKKLARDVEILTCRSNNACDGVCDVYLVGTIHSSQKSCKEVGQIIRFLKPEVVFLELCSSCQSMLATTSFQIYIRGSEFRVAYEEANKYGGRVELGDRPQKITRLRARRKTPLREKINYLFSPFTDHSLNDKRKKLSNSEYDIDDLQILLEEIGKKFPTFMEIGVHERDQYMCFHLANTASKSSSVVAVVGKGHLQGMKKYWMKPIKMKDLENLETIPPSKAIILAYLLAGVVTGIFLSLKTY